METVLGQLTPTTVALTSSMNPAIAGQSLEFSAQLDFAVTAGVYPTGSVTFTDTATGNVLGTGKVQTSGAGRQLATAASLAMSSLASGSYSVMAAYSGDNVYAPSSSQTLQQQVQGTSGPGAPSIQPVGTGSLGAYGGYTSIAPGTWVEIHGSNLASGTRTWASTDFHGVEAPTTLEGSEVTIGGQSAFVEYISSGQINVQVPSTVAPGSQSLVVTTPAGSSSPFQVTVNSTQPGLLAPPSFAVGGKQFVAALFLDGTTYVLPPGAVAGVSARRAKPGDVITFFGIGFGPVTPDNPAGQIVQGSNTLAAPIQISFGNTAAAIDYAGLALGFMGLYQFNVVVPNVPPSDAVPVTFTLGGVAGLQTLFTAVEN
jgi:uncharacterized protein (TIGR03437 family)